MIKSYGLQLKPIESDHYIFGAFTSLPKIILQPDGQWDDFLPSYEPQSNENFDSYGCTVWGTENALETLEKKLTGKEANYSERFPYILASIRPPGADPHKLAEVIREHGLVPDFMLPMTLTYAEFTKPDPMEGKYLDEGKKWKQRWKVGHEWIPTVPDAMKEALKYSPLCVSVTAWEQDSDGLYIDNGQPNTHWTVVYGYVEKDGKTYWKVFDSYDHSLKVLHPDHMIQVCKRYHLEAISQSKKSFWERLISFISKLWK